MCNNTYNVPTILKLFYNSSVESVLTFSFIGWFSHLNPKRRNSLQRNVTVNSKIICDKVTPLSLLCDQQILHKGIYSKGPWACPLWWVWLLAPWVPVQITGTQNQQKRKLFVPTVVWLLKGASSAIWTVLTILYGFTRVAVWLGLSGVYGSSNVRVYLVDDSSGVYVCGWVWMSGAVG